MDFSKFSSLALPEVESHLQEMLVKFVTPDFHELREMLVYHMGWEKIGFIKSSGGKRIRPLLVLLCADACGTDWRKSLPAASAVELIHNFSLIHDDIQDNSPLRRGRDTIWVKWGIPQAINAGDLMFTIGHQSMLDLFLLCEDTEIVRKACHLLLQSCNMLTRGQFLDLLYETRVDVKLNDYWKMISGKTAALLSCSTELGAIIAGAGEHHCDLFRQFGFSLGLAFQIQDDWLGIWGDSALTGKATDSDLVAGKKTLPIIFGLSKEGEFARRWDKGSISPEESSRLADMLVDEGAREYTEMMVISETEKAVKFLIEAVPNEEKRKPLTEITEMLLKRKN